MKNKVIEFLAKQILNFMPKWKTRILLYIGYAVSAYNIFLTPEILQQINDAFHYDLGANKTFGIIVLVFNFLMNLTTEAKELRFKQEMKNLK
jgi:hypothetical protein